MDSETFKLLDTALKIGLGALISGVVTYVITKQKHNDELNKEIIIRRLDSLENAISKVNEYASYVHDYIAYVDGYVRAHPKEDLLPDHVKFKTMEKKVGEVRKTLYEGKSLFRMIALEDIGKIISELALLEEKVRKKIVFEKIVPTRVEVDSWSMELRELELKFYKEVSEIYQVK